MEEASVTRVVFEAREGKKRSQAGYEGVAKVGNGKSSREDGVKWEGMLRVAHDVWTSGARFVEKYRGPRDISTSTPKR